MQERDISLMDLIVEILLCWRGIIVSMLIGAIAMGGLGYVQSYRTFKEQEAKVEAAKQQLELEIQQAQVATQTQQQNQLDPTQVTEEWLKGRLTEEQIQNVQYVISYEKVYIDKIVYQKQSVLMQVDPNSIQKAEITFYVQADDVIAAYNAERIYEDLVIGGELLEVLAETLNITSAAASEMISIERGSDGSEEGTNTFRVSVIHYDTDLCQKAVQAVMDYIEGKHDELETTIGNHEIKVLNQSLAAVTDTRIMSHQKNYLNDIAVLRQAVADMKAKFGSVEWLYYDFMVNGKITDLGISKMKTSVPAPSAVTEEEGEALSDIINKGVTVHPGISIKYVILGMILAAFIYVFVVFIKYVLNTKLRTTDSLTSIYGIPQLGMVYSDARSNRSFGFVDQWILSIRDRNRRKFTEQESLELASVAVKMAVGKESLNVVYVIGCDLKDRALAVCEQIKIKLGEEDLRVEVLNNVLYDAQAMAELESAKGAVLVERAGSTLYEEIAQEVELLSRQGIELLGGIVVE